VVILSQAFLVHFARQRRQLFCAANSSGRTAVNRTASCFVVSLAAGAAGWLAAWAAVVGAAELRTWTDNTGKHRLEAELIEVTAGGKVRLRKANGAVVSIPRAKLSTEDQTFLEATDDITPPVKVDPQPPETTKTPSPELAASDEWFQWRGPNRNGISPDAGLLKEWPKEGPPLLWTAKDLGSGFSSIVISKGRIFTLGRIDDGEHLIAIDGQTRERLWTLRVSGSDAPNSTPTVDGELVYALGRDGDLVCAETATGKEVWRKNYARDFEGRMMSGWGYSESPLVDGEHLIVTPGGQKAMLAALNKKTGETVWTTPMPEDIGGAGTDGAGYASLVVSTAGGVRQYVTLVGRGVISADAKSGELLWHYNAVANGTANIPTPLIHNDFVFCSSGYGAGAALLKLAGEDNKISAQQVYFLEANKLQNHHGGMILLGEHVYCGHGHNEGMPLCVDLKTGADAWRPGRGPGRGSAAIAAADGHVYLRYDDGTVALVEATPKAYTIKGKFTLPTHHGESWPHPAISGGKLYLRDQNELHCYNLKP
jgi:outer membrane protein assembly factor BamB